MSGGTLNYIYFNLSCEAETVESRAEHEGDPELKEALLSVAKEMHKCSKLAKEAEGFLSGDTGSDTFLNRVQKIVEGD